jgi:hypothetical protein
MIDKLQAAIAEAAKVVESYQMKGASEEQLREASHRLGNIFVEVMFGTHFMLEYVKPNGQPGLIGHDPTKSPDLRFATQEGRIVYISNRAIGHMEATPEDRLEFIGDAPFIIEALMAEA